MQTPANTDILMQFKIGLVIITGSIINVFTINKISNQNKKGKNTWIYTSDIPDVFVYPRHKSVWVGFLDIRPFSMWG